MEGRRSGRAERLLQIPLDGPGVAHLSGVGVGAGVTEGATLTQEVPAAVELDFDGVQSLAVGLQGVVRVAVGLLAPTKIMLLGYKAFDPARDALVAHGTRSY
ncbi:MAG TPA: hypothetical protein VE780_01395 [Thermoleophilaceae bacterium]|nr:hypothetical protein [Thermoleophilaceae bacterium]